MAVGELLVGLAVGQDDLVGVDDDDVVAAVLIGGEPGLVLPTEQVRGLSREAAENDIGGVNDVPVLLDVARLRCVRAHGRCLRFSLASGHVGSSTEASLDDETTVVG